MAYTLSLKARATFWLERLILVCFKQCHRFCSESHISVSCISIWTGNEASCAWILFASDVELLACTDLELQLFSNAY